MDLQIIRKWILASLRRDTDRWAGLFHSGGGERKRYTGFYSGEKKVCQQNLYVMRGSVPYRRSGRVERHRKIFWILLWPEKDFANFKAGEQVRPTALHIARALYKS